MGSKQDEKLAKLLQCKWACDLCEIEILARKRKKEEEQARKKEQSFFKKVVDFFTPSNDLPFPTIPQFWELYQIRCSEISKQAILTFLNSGFNHFISRDNNSDIFSRKSLCLCYDHFKEVTKNNVRKDYYCTTCGEDYTLEESEHFGLNFPTGLSQIIICRRCSQPSFALPTISIVQTIKYLQYCANCNMSLEYDNQAFGSAKPMYVVKNCSKCGSSDLQHMEVVEFVWSSKEMIGYLDTLVCKDRIQSDPTHCSHYHNNSVGDYQFCPICGKNIK